MILHVSEVFSFPLLDPIPLCAYTVICLPVLLLTYTRAFRAIGIVLLLTFLYRSLGSVWEHSYWPVPKSRSAIGCSIWVDYPKPFSQNGCTFWHSHQQYKRIPIALHFPHMLVFLYSWGILFRRFLFLYCLCLVLTLGQCWLIMWIAKCSLLFSFLKRLYNINVNSSLNVCQNFPGKPCGPGDF